MLKVQRELLYGGPLQRGKRYHFVAYLNGEQISTAETKEQAIVKAEAALLETWKCSNTSVIASKASERD